MSGSWYIERSDAKVIYIFKNGKRLRAEGNYREGMQPTIEWVGGVKPYIYEGKDYVLVSCKRNTELLLLLSLHDIELDIYQQVTNLVS